LQIHPSLFAEVPLSISPSLVSSVGQTFLSWGAEPLQQAEALSSELRRTLMIDVSEFNVDLKGLSHGLDWAFDDING
jgi:hypothetical protein